jgi:hypothetical protein
MNDVPASIQLLHGQVPTIVKAVQPVMREKFVKTRWDCLMLFRKFLNALPVALGNHIVHGIVNGIHYAFSDKNTTSNMNIGTP